MALENKLVFIQTKKTKPNTSNVSKYGMPPMKRDPIRKRDNSRNTPNCAQATLSKVSTMGNNKAAR